MNKIGWLEKWTLRFAVAGLVWLAVNGFEGILMRTQLVAPQATQGHSRRNTCMHGHQHQQGKQHCKDARADPDQC